MSTSTKVAKKHGDKSTPVKVEIVEPIEEPKVKPSSDEVQQPINATKTPANESEGDNDGVHDAVHDGTEVVDEEAQPNPEIREMLINCQKLVIEAKQLAKRIHMITSVLPKLYRKDMKRYRLRTKRAAGAPAGVLIQKPVPQAFREFFEIGDDVMMSRPQVFQKISEYVNLHQLRVKENRKSYIVPDERIRRLFSLEHSEINRIGFTDLQKMMAEVYNKEKQTSTNTPPTEPVTAPNGLVMETINNTTD